MDKEIQNKILNLLYGLRRENKQDTALSNIIIEKIGMNVTEFTVNMDYLIEKNYVRTQSFTTGFLHEKYYVITVEGVEYFENKDKLNEIFPNNYKVVNSPGTIINSENASVVIYDSFNQLYDDVQRNDVENIAEIKNKLHLLEKELKKDNINKSKVNKTMGWLKEKAPDWIVAAALQLTLKMIIGSPNPL